MHELQCRCCCFWSLGFVDVDLHGHLGAHSYHTLITTYHRGIKLIHRLPLLLSGLHHIDFFVLQRSLRLHVLHNSLCRVAQPTRAASEERYSTIKKTGSSSEHVYDTAPTSAIDKGVGVMWAEMIGPLGDRKGKYAYR
jgi:hypothetical protein